MVSAHMLAQAAQLLVWYNAVFVIIFCIGLFFTFLQLLGLSHGSHVDGDAGADGHIDVDADADAGMDAQVDTGVDAPADADVHAEADAATDAHAEAHAHAHGDGGAATAGAHSVGLGYAVAQLLGLGKVPLSISLMLLGYTMGIAGWMSNEVLSRRIASERVFFPLSLLFSLAAGFVVLRLTAMLMARYLPTLSTSAIPRQQLVGLTARTTLPVNERFGQASLHDKFGTLHVVGCKVRPGGGTIEKGAEVVLIKYLPDRDVYIVGRA
ncbi:MAG: DUF1449 family protein [Phycisphaerae bacterium]|jgi:hypothetical protein